ncbi:hypothetical protein AB0M41_39015 [Streptomyces sp. NPDC051896]|uniref:hypothetical protein n=1 Tax=Streptomyces sp. NPDC051896 TaxID=3155416 RepID=UPI0034310CCE
MEIEHTPIRDEKEPFVYSAAGFRDSDKIQIEFVAVGWTGKPKAPRLSSVEAGDLPGEFGDESLPTTARGSDVERF